ncbi:MAG: ABC transporter, permease protein 1 (cluster 1, maltose/g3p/polyamine/iron) [uncultured Thermomicrobiales bacterium]|uniref:ABC transporter, permease protein 1 (Cluster 1, maltose/g3p/polyamine/iron) n=1 Tax=uncultured Thermomicrobiales bacterium TaxID=1645740 RepID=A0A6J4UNQ7_9BACT|nr:MAG: ABC transporter, permease protein 1 (cluster 1, maltose/g3p/polyamine/iron) [uncultured Thermomicrobiales bacterium]
MATKAPQLDQFDGAMTGSAPVVRRDSALSRAWREFRTQRVLYLMVLPGVLYFLVFRYYPMYGAIIAFKEYRVLDGILGSPWVGLHHFRAVFNSTYFPSIVENTLLISLYRFSFGIPVGIALALMLNEVRIGWFKQGVQTVTYLPHFLSWVIVFGVLQVLLGTPNGLINQPLVAAGGNPINFLADPNWFRTVLVASGMWKEVGWSAIIYLAALASISNELYEAASVDGASRLRRVWDISLPGILPVVLLVSLLNLGNLLSAGFEQVFIMYNPAVYGVGDIIDTWVYRTGIQNFGYSVGAAVGLFKGVVGMVLIVGCNWLARKTTGKGIIW